MVDCELFDGYPAPFDFLLRRKDAFGLVAVDQVVDSGYIGFAVFETEDRKQFGNVYFEIVGILVVGSFVFGLEYADDRQSRTAAAVV